MIRKKCIPEPDYNYYQAPIGIYYTISLVQKYFSRLRKEAQRVRIYESLHSYIKQEKT